MEKEQQIYEQQGMEEYIKYQVEHETQPFSPGPAFSFVKVRAYEETEVEKQTLTHCSDSLVSVLCVRSCLWRR